jgi:hypothetical protein
MAVIAATGYFDDSRTDGRVCTVAGLVGNKAQWEQFESAWTPLLERHGVPWLHMKEMADPNGHFKKWLPPQDHRAELKAFFSDVARTINDCRFGAFGATVRLQDLERFNSEKGLKLDPYALAVYGCMVHIKQGHPTEIVNLIFDRIEKVDSRLKKAQQYAEADNFYVGVTDFIQPIPDVGELRARWHTVFRRRAPPHLPRHLLFRILAYRLQADRLGELDTDSRRLLDRIGSGPAERIDRLVADLNRSRTELRPGTLLTREWDGHLQRVMVLADGFAWNGKTYPSLSKVAFAMTGTRWSGPRFFGLDQPPSERRP